MAVFRRITWIYHIRRRKLPYTVNFTTVLVSKVYPSQDRRLRDKTFRQFNIRFFERKRKFPVAVFVPGILNAPSKAHPSKNRRLRDETFRPPWLDYYQPNRVLYPSQFVPGILNAPSRIHPSRNRRLRDETFRPPWLDIYQPNRVLYPAVFVPGTIRSIHPRLKNVWDRKTPFGYYSVRRKLPPTVIPDASFLGVSKIHPSQNVLLRHRDTATQYYYYYQPAHVMIFTVGVVSTGLTEVLFKGMWRGMFRKMR